MASEPSKEAVEAAARALNPGLAWDNGKPPGEWKQRALSDAKNVLTAALPFLAPQLAAKDEQIAALTGERDRQYEHNVGQIVKQAELEAQIAALREALKGARAYADGFTNWGDDVTVAKEAREQVAAIDAALEMSGGVL